MSQFNKYSNLLHPKQGRPKWDLSFTGSDIISKEPSLHAILPLQWNWNQLELTLDFIQPPTNKKRDNFWFILPQNIKIYTSPRSSESRKATGGSLFSNSGKPLSQTTSFSFLKAYKGSFAPKIKIQNILKSKIPHTKQIKIPHKLHPFSNKAFQTIPTKQINLKNQKPTHKPKIKP